MVKKEQGNYITKLHIGRIYRKGELIFLIDENKNSYPVNSLLFLDKFFNPQEGDIELPKVWEDQTETIKEFTGSTKPTEGDVVIFGFIEGKASYPIILGSVIQLRLLGNADIGKYRDDFLSFLNMQEKKLLIKENIKRKIVEKEDGYGKIERSITTFEDIENEGDPQEERGTINFSISKEGDIQLDITEILEKTGKGNIVLNLKGNDGQANGNFTFNFNGKLNLINTNDEGNPTGTKISIDNTKGEEKIEIEDVHGNKYHSTKDGVKILVVGDADIEASENAVIKAKNVNVEASGNALIGAKDTKIGSLGASQAVCLKGLIDWVLTHKHLDILGGPDPVFPADLAILTAKVNTPGGGVVSNKANETLEVSG